LDRIGFGDILNSMKPVLRHIANLWTFLEHPSPSREWPLSDKIQAIADAGFDGVCWSATAELAAELQLHNLLFVGGMATSQETDIAALLENEAHFGATHVNVQLGTDETLLPEALRLTLTLMHHGKHLGLLPAVETHRGTCTETPEKTYALADAYLQATGEPLRISCDLSHFALVKHLTPDTFSRRLLVRPELIQHAQQFHLRPFNGHHAQLPITNADGNLTPEVEAWLPFAEDLLRCWLEANRDTGREIFVCPELGPLPGGYALSTFPNSWDDAKRLRTEIDALWNRLNV
jgi:sugar phosphate isomerase/epimerase